jgi:hypothetical protein
MIALVVFIVAFSLSACGEHDDPAANVPASHLVPDDNLFKDKLRALEQAVHVQKTLNNAAARQQEVLEAQARW